jgi:hypothetical protein
MTITPRSLASAEGERFEHGSVLGGKTCAAWVSSQWKSTAKELREDVDWLFDVAVGMDTEDGVIWVYGVGDEGVMAFTDFGIENLVELIQMHKDDPSLLHRGDNEK